MNGILAQAIAIATHGAAWLAAPIGDPPDLTGNSTLQYVSTLDFDGQSLPAWLRSLADAGVREIGLAVPDVSRRPADAPLAWVPWHLRAAYAGGLPVGLRTGGATVWRAEWSRVDGDPQRPWRVRYLPGPADEPPDRPAFDEARDRLVEALLAATQFARTHGLEPWDMTFEQARVVGLSGHPQAADHDDVVPSERLSLARRQLWAMATGAEVFGGMGSWNDASFADPAAQRSFDEISATLYACLIRAFSACVNTPDAGATTTAPTTAS